MTTGEKNRSTGFMIEDIEQKSGLTEGELEQTDAYVDVTEEVSVYAKGKTFECECGQGFGVEFYIHMVRCPTCGKFCVDRFYKSRERQAGEEDADKQQTLFDYDEEEDTEPQYFDKEKVEEKGRQTGLFEHEEDDDQSHLADFG